MATKKEDESKEVKKEVGDISTNSSLNVYQRLAKAMSLTTAIKKEGKVQFKGTSYSYQKAEDIIAMARPILLECGLVLIPTRSAQTRVDQLTLLHEIFELVNIDKPEERIYIENNGQGMDGGEKGIGKANTYSLKYLFKRLLLIEDGGDDPDKNPSDANSYEPAPTARKVASSVPGQISQATWGLKPGQEITVGGQVYTFKIGEGNYGPWYMLKPKTTSTNDGIFYSKKDDTFTRLVEQYRAGSLNSPEPEDDLTGSDFWAQDYE